MTVTISIIDDKTILLERSGLITAEQLVTAYQRVLTMKFEYIILDNTNMMYSVDSIYNADVRPWVRKILQRDELNKVVVILPEDDELRARVTGSFDEFHVSEKLIFATCIESAKITLSKIQ